MTKIFSVIIFSLLLMGRAYACGGDFYSVLFDISKEHKICGKLVRS
jgi:hypothetical protein